MAKYKNYRYCFVPSCSSTSVKTPEKRFIGVPRIEKIRKKWLAACKRDDGSMKSNFYICEDHFDIEEDFANVVQHNLTGCSLRLKEGVLPSKFDCQPGRMCSYFARKTVVTLKHSKSIMKISNPRDKNVNSLILAHSRSQTCSKPASKDLEENLGSKPENSQSMPENSLSKPENSQSKPKSSRSKRENSHLQEKLPYTKLAKVKKESIDNEFEKEIQTMSISPMFSSVNRKLQKPNSAKCLSNPSSNIIGIQPVLQNQESSFFLSNESNNIIGLQTVLQNQSSTRFISSESSNIIGIQTVRPIGIIAANIQVPILQKQASAIHIPSSLPASQNWPGEYGFTVSFNQEQNNSKAYTWTYSKVKNKLYVKKDASCPINFSANTILPNDVIIRATALYSSPDHASEVVRRCINHSTEDLNKGLVEAEHLIRCECRNAQYKVDPVTHRHSVIVSFENPPAGHQFSTYIYKFTCFGSCIGGPNRRPLMIVFTLERNNQVIGRHRLDVKICACPGRDQKFEECLQIDVEDPLKGQPSDFMNLSDSMHFIRNVAYPLPKNIKLSPNNEGLYTIQTGNLNCFEFLKQMKTFYEICKTMKGLPPDISSALVNFQQQQIDNEDS